VLAVGDAAFQKKCLGRMRDVASTGRNGDLRQSQHGGSIVALFEGRWCCGKVRLSIRWAALKGRFQQYLSQVHKITKTKLADRTDRQGNGKVRIKDFVTCDKQGNELEYLATGQEVDFRIYYSSNEANLQNVSVAIGISSNSLGLRQHVE
jgi:lipopolysaccharide transport system ATP-binding protein